jgi:hypothetical protein
MCFFEGITSPSPYQGKDPRLRGNDDNFFE